MDKIRIFCDVLAEIFIQIRWYLKKLCKKIKGDVFCGH